ncbi:MAG: hypothetical protein LBC80_05120 [Treponema sp.]|jgi:hypothetical protein|nr:hypothetical protein [Treponema sp.]
MNKDERLEKVCKDFSMLNEEQQDYILGILQALVFAKTTGCQPEPPKKKKQGSSISVSVP